MKYEKKIVKTVMSLKVNLIVSADLLAFFFGAIGESKIWLIKNY